jgi:DNA-binding FadR family transcriptional regulator
MSSSLTRAGLTVLFHRMLPAASYRDQAAYMASQPATRSGHRTIYEAIAAGDPGAARRAAREHLTRVREQGDRLVTGESTS